MRHGGKRRLGLGLVMGIGIVIGSAAAPAWACSVCQAGDPVFSASGVSAGEPGDVSVYLELQGWRKTSGLLPHDDGSGHHDEHEGREVNESQILQAYLSVSPIDRLTLGLQLPYRFNAIIEQPRDEERTRATHSGIGDVALMGSFVLWRDRDVLPATWLEQRLFLKLPTGERRQKVEGARDPHLQLGTGSWDVGLGLAAGHRTSGASFYGSAFYRFNQEGALDYEYGDVALVNAGVEPSLAHLLDAPSLDFLAPALELNFRYAGADQVDGSRYRHSGGAILYLTPSLRVRLPWTGMAKTPSLRVAAQLPLGQSWLHHQQHEGIVWSTGLLLPF